ncbi:hypothetical protein GOBAR_AA12069 [Gossypium barbadense]|uniref:Ribulose bisphosphate carboxylase large chain n=1 Tax=Gossypium barbadense TaxID=3634 RepID=A0A2P5XZ23_GOSBA|nr:hypothetical protein GOBAR_AA12069 [Gossypium barbadense]
MNVKCQLPLANKFVDIEVPQAIFLVIVFEAAIRIPYDLKQVLANAFQVTSQPRVLLEEAGAAVAAESSTDSVFKFKALRTLLLEDLRIPTIYIKTFQSPPHGIQVERNKLNRLDFTKDDENMNS